MNGERYVGVVLDYLLRGRYVLQWVVDNIFWGNDYFIDVVVNKDGFEVG